MGPPGCGKSTMIARTALARPVHIIDVDRKILSCGLDLPDVTVWELAEALTEDSMANRLRALVENKKPQTAPQGWPKYSRMVDELTKRPESMAAGTWAVDSYTRLQDHLKRQILYLDAKGAANLSPRNYGALLGMLEEATSQLIDLAKANGKDLIITVHERVSELPGPNTKVVHVKNERGDIEREFEGTMEMKITPSIEGQFSQKMLSYFDEAYGLSVQMVNGKPMWVCRVMPDGRRDLRTSLPVDGKEVFPCDFREIGRGVTTKTAPTLQEGVASAKR